MSQHYSPILSSTVGHRNSNSPSILSFNKEMELIQEIEKQRQIDLINLRNELSNMSSKQLIWNIAAQYLFSIIIIFIGIIAIVYVSMIAASQTVGSEQTKSILLDVFIVIFLGGYIIKTLIDISDNEYVKEYKSR